MITIYGIKNCDTIKKAIKWLNAHDIEYHFHDYREDGIDQTLLTQFLDNIDWEILLNRRGTTWRKLPEDRKHNINKNSAMQVMQEQPAIIKRPVLVSDNTYLVGFKPQDYQALFN